MLLSTASMRVRFALLLGFALAALPLQALAQLQRSFQNLGFETPSLTAADPAAGCYVQVTDAQVPGWSTNHPNVAGSGSCTSPVAVTGSLIELWRTNFQGVPAREGVNFAEINAEAVSRLFQTICVVNGEQVAWQLSHRGRSGTDVMSFNVNSSANQILRASTDTAGAGVVLAGSCGTGLVGSATCNAPVTTNTWADYTGTFVWNGASGLQDFGFEAISTGSGSATVGNFLDNIQVTLTPYVQFVSATGSGPESTGTGLPRISIVGNFAVPLTLLLQINNGASTAALGTDFTTPGGGNNFSVTIPAGNYDGSVTFDTGITVLNDAVIENNETIAVRFRANPSTYTVASTQSCGATPISQTVYTILDDDVDLRTTKTLDTTATPPGGGSSQFTVTYQNNTARPTVGDATAHDATATIADALPTGFTAFSWTCTASGTPAPTCPAAGGSGAINNSVTLPAGNAAAGGTLTFVITGTLASSQCTSTTNTSTVTAIVPFQEGTSAQNNFTTPAPGGAANNAASAAVDPLCADLKLTKTNTPGVNGDVDQAADTVTSGSTTVYTIVVSNSGPDAASGSVIRDPSPTALICSTANCGSPIGGAVCPATTSAALVTALQSVGGVVIPTLPANSSLTFTLTCSVQ